MEDGNYPFHYYGAPLRYYSAHTRHGWRPSWLCVAAPNDTLAQHGRGVPEPFYAFNMDTYGPTISDTIGEIRDARAEEYGDYRGEYAWLTIG